MQQPILSRSNVTLTCAVDLSPVVNIPVTVSIVWTGPNVTRWTTTMEEYTKYLSIVEITSARPSNTGTYECETLTTILLPSPYVSDTQRHATARKDLVIGMIRTQATFISSKHICNCYLQAMHSFS